MLPEQLPATWRTEVTRSVCAPAMPLPEFIAPLPAVLPVIEPVEPAVDEGVLDEGVLGAVLLDVRSAVLAVDPALEPVEPLLAVEPAVLPAPYEPELEAPVEPWLRDADESSVPRTSTR